MKMNDASHAGFGHNSQTIELSKPQLQLVTATERFPAFVGGFGSGKTEALLNRAIVKKMQYPYQDIAYYLPTYDHVSTIGFPRFEEKLDNMMIPYKSRTGSKPRIMIEDCGLILFRNMDNPNRIVGYEVGDSFVDEIDTLKTKDALLAWRKLVARNRQVKRDGKSNSVAVGTTPEGFKFVYDFWKKAPPSDQYRLIKASTYSNQRNLEANYIPDLIAMYPAQLVAAYINGDFVNLASGAVYPDFSRELNGCKTEIIPGEMLHIGMDFNVRKGAAVINVLRDNCPHAVGELVNTRDTPETIALLKQQYPGNPKMIYPDATGKANDSGNASQSDLTQLTDAGFSVQCFNANPLIKDRVASFNAMICNAKGERRFKVNCDKCPTLVAGLEQQIYDDNGFPDKTAGIDHHLDAEGYLISFRWPIIRRQASHTVVLEG
jgi:hypothetical protein